MEKLPPSSNSNQPLPSQSRRKRRGSKILLKEERPSIDDILPDSKPPVVGMSSNENMNAVNENMNAVKENLAMQKFINEINHGWNEDIDNYGNEWLKMCCSYSSMHKKSANLFKRIYIIFKLFSVLFNIFVTVCLAILLQYNNEKELKSRYFYLFVVCLGFLSLFIEGGFQIFDPDGRSDDHKQASEKYMNIHRTIQTELQFQYGERVEAKHFFSIISSQFNSISSDSPSLPSSVSKTYPLFSLPENPTYPVDLTPPPQHPLQSSPSTRKTNNMRIRQIMLHHHQDSSSFKK